MLPRIFFQGDFVTWLDRLEFSPASYRLRTSFRNYSGQGLEVVAEPEGENFRSRITDLESRNLAPGLYWAQQTVTDLAGAGRKTIMQTPVLVRPDVSVTQDLRTQAEKDLAAVEECLRSRLEGRPVQSYSIKDRSLTYLPIPDLLQLKASLQRVVAAERELFSRLNGQVRDNLIKIKF